MITFSHKQTKKIAHKGATNAGQACQKYHDRDDATSVPNKAGTFRIRFTQPIVRRCLRDRERRWTEKRTDCQDIMESRDAAWKSNRFSGYLDEDSSRNNNDAAAKAGRLKRHVCSKRCAGRAEKEMVCLNVRWFAKKMSSTRLPTKGGWHECRVAGIIFTCFLAYFIWNGMTRVNPVGRLCQREAAYRKFKKRNTFICVSYMGFGFLQLRNANCTQKVPRADGKRCRYDFIKVQEDIGAKKGKEYRATRVLVVSANRFVISN